MENLRGGEGERYGINRRYFRVSDFINTVQRFLDEQSSGQELDPIYRGARNAEHVCLPNPHYRPSDTVPVRPVRHELALPRQDLERHWAPRAFGAGDSQDTAEAGSSSGPAVVVHRPRSTDARIDRDRAGRL